MNLKRMQKALEITWLCVAVLCVGVGIHKTYTFGFVNSYTFFILAVVATAMYFFRKKMRKQNPQ